MKAYHYTSAENWESIKTFGFKPYLIKKEELDQYFPGGVMGVWLWTHKLEGLSHAGTVLYQASNRASVNIVQLEVEIAEKKLLTWNGRPVRVYHKGHLEKLVYHANEEGCIAVGPILPDQVKLVKTFNIEKLLA